MLEELLGSEAMKLTVRPTNCDMRTCTSIVASDSTTELVEPSCTISPQSVADLMWELEENYSKEKASALVIMGSMPPGCDDDLYANIYSAIADRNTLCLIDSVAGLGPLLQTVATSSGGCGPVILKVNASELCRLAALKKPSARNEAGGVSTEELVQAISGFFDKYSPAAADALEAICITDGPHPAFVAVAPVSADESEFKLFQLSTARLATTNDKDSDQNGSRSTSTNRRNEDDDNTHQTRKKEDERGGGGGGGGWLSWVKTDLPSTKSPIHSHYDDAKSSGGGIDRS